MEQNQTTIGQRIALRRRELHMTQDQLAQALGVSPQAVSKWENNLSCPDISILPQLAQLLDLTTDELLGAAPRQTHPDPPEEPEPPESSGPEIFVESDDGSSFSVHIGSSRRAGLSTAAWLVATGLLSLADLFLRSQGITPAGGALGLWNAMWISALLVWGIFGMLRRVKCSNILLTAAGVYFALDGMDALPTPLEWNVLLPLLLVVMGICLVVDNLGKKKRPSFTFHGPVIPVINASSTNNGARDGLLEAANSFGTERIPVCCPLLRGGEVSNSFGELLLDLTGVEQLAPGCPLTLTNSFGEVTLRVPSRFRVDYDLRRGFSEVTVHGHPDSAPAGILILDGAVSFGEVHIHYV